MCNRMNTGMLTLLVSLAIGSIGSAAAAVVPVKASASERVAQEMVDAYASQRGIGPFYAIGAKLTAEQDAQFKSLWTLVLGQVSDSGLKAQFYGILSGYFVARARMNVPDLSVYELRFKAILGSSVEAWHPENRRLNVDDLHPMQILVTLIFLDRLWKGDALKAGQLDKVFGRFQSLSADAVAKWGEAIGGDKATGTDGAASNRGEAAYTLITVDGLFSGGVFQPSTFEAALPRARALVASVPKLNP